MAGRVNFKRGALTAREIKAMDDRGAGFYEDLLPARFLKPQKEEKTPKVKEQANSKPRRESE